MTTEITQEQKELLSLLTKMSNTISNAVWFAENGEKDVDSQIEMGIWLAKHFLEEIEDKKKNSICQETNSLGR